MIRTILGTCLFALLTTPALASTELVEISGPILPDVLVLYASEGANYPTTTSAQQALAMDAALTFPQLLDECAPQYPAITLLAPGGPSLTTEQLATNYDQVAECAYVTHTAKPYWIPQLIDDVDICAGALGSDWRLITENDLDGFTEQELRFFADTLSGVAGTSSGMGKFYFSLTVYVRGDDGTLKQGTLEPSVTSRVWDLPVAGASLKSHLEGDTALRCIRRTTLSLAP